MTAATSLGPVDLGLAEAIATVPEFGGFLGVDALYGAFEGLADAHPEHATLTRIGTSRLGEPLIDLTIGSEPGRPNAVVFGFPHPNEPIGGLTALHLASQLCTNPGLRARLDYTWHINPCIDPDGTRLNEAWFDGPFTRSFYGRRFYRPPGDEQVEWTFPFAYKRAYFDRVLPETQALMRLIDDTRPAFMASLHNGEYGGVYYYLSRPAPELYPTLHGIADHVGLPLDTGEPEVPFVERYAPAIFEMISSATQYDFTESVGLDPTERQAGESSASYAARHGTLTLVSELPYWTHPDANDDSLIDETYAAVLSQRADGLQATHEVLDAVLVALGNEQLVDSPFLRASKTFVPMFARQAQQERARAADPANARPATAGERFGCLDTVHSFRLRFGGILLRALDGELAIGHGTPEIRAQHRGLEQCYEGWAATADAEMGGGPIPIGKLVAVQYAALLATADQAHPARG